MNTLTTIIAKIISAPLIAVLTLAGYPLQPQTIPTTYQEQVREYVDQYVKESIKDTQKDIRLGAAPDYFAGTTFFLAGAGISSSATSITLTSLTISQTGQKIVTGDLIAGVGNKFYVTIEPGNRSKQEVVSCTTITQNANGTATLSGCSRGLSPITPYTASTTLSFVHGGGSSVLFSNPPNIYRDLVSYIDAASVAGAVDSSLTAKGIVEKASANEAASNAQVGSGNTTAPLALTADIASSTREASTARVVVASSTTGYIDRSFVSPTLSFPSGVNLHGTTTSQDVLINGYAPWQLLAATTTTVTGLSSFSLTFPTRSTVQIQIIASSSVGTSGGIKYTFNGDSATNYRVGRPDGTGTALLSAATSSIDVMACSVCGAEAAEYVIMDVTGIGDGRSVALIRGLRFNLSNSSVRFASSTMAYYGGSAKVTSIEVVGHAGATIGIGTQVRVYGQTSI